MKKCMLEPQRSVGAYSTVIHCVGTSFGDISLLKVVQLFHQLLTEGESKDRKREHTRCCREREHCLVYLCGLTNLIPTLALPSPPPSTTLLCIQLTNTKHSWQHGTRCRDGANVLWCRPHLVCWLVFHPYIYMLSSFGKLFCDLY